MQFFLTRFLQSRSAVYNKDIKIIFQSRLITAIYVQLSYKAFKNNTTAAVAVSQIRSSRYKRGKFFLGGK